VIRKKDYAKLQISFDRTKIRGRLNINEDGSLKFFVIRRQSNTVCLTNPRQNNNEMPHKRSVAYETMS